MKDKVIVPKDLPVGEYVLSWRWDCYMADQIWSNCADVEITGSQPTTTTTSPATTSTSTASTSNSGCVDRDLPIEWSQAGRFDCNYFRERGAAYTNPLAYCAHAAIRNSCCFCEAQLRQNKEKRRALRRGHSPLALIQIIQNMSQIDSKSADLDPEL